MIIDASVLVSLLIPNDVNHKRAVNFFKHADEPCLIPSFAFVEVAAALKRNRAPEHALEGFQEFLKQHVDVIETDENLINQAISVAKKVGTRGADSLYVALAEDMKESLATFDVEQKRLAFGFGLRITEC